MAATPKPVLDARRFRRTREYGAQQLAISYSSREGTKGECAAKLWDFSEGGLGMDSPRPFEPGEIIQIEAVLKGFSYSMGLDAKARVAYCRKTAKKTYRVGVAFLEVTYRPALGS